MLPCRILLPLQTIVHKSNPMTFSARGSKCGRTWDGVHSCLLPDTVVSATAGANNYYDGFPSPAFYFYK